MTGLQISGSEMEAFRGLIDWFATDHRPLIPYAQVECIQQGWRDVVFGKNLLDKPICLAGTEFENGIATHCDSIIKIRLTRPAVKFSAFAGIDYNPDTLVKNSTGKFASAVFSVFAGRKQLWQSGEICVNDAPEKVEIDLGGVEEFCLHAKACDSIQFAHADWAGAVITYADGKKDTFTTEGGVGCSFLQLPVSFEYDGRKSQELLKVWDYKYDCKALDDGLNLHTAICSDTETGLECEVSLKEYPDFPACWYQVKFRNTSDKDSAIIRDIRSLDLRWRQDEQNRTFVTTWTGSNLAEHDDFDSQRNFLERQAVLEEDGIHLAGQLGRCSGNWLPFLNLEQGGRGLFVAVGWTGQWSCDVACDRRYMTTIRAGMEQTHFILRAGEEVSQPSIMLMFLEDNTPVRRQNIFRRFMREHIIPKEQGRPVVTPISCTTWGGMPAELHLRAIDEIKKHSLPYEIYWIDAGWYGPEGNVSADEFSPGWVEHTGNWSVNPSIYPEGFKPISEAAHQAGMKFLVWMEPERACIGTPLTEEHPDWFLSDSDTLSRGVSVLLNLGNEQALTWLIEFVSQFIAENGLDVYRQDFNYMPLASWRRNDSPDRQGVTEIRHIEGLYRFWDELRNRFPDLLIDNCASGGRRIDIETMSRSIPLWASDVQCSPDHNPDASQLVGKIEKGARWSIEMGTT